MDTKEFRVDVYCRQRAVYRVRANDVESARRFATERWQRGEASDFGGFEACELDSVKVRETLEPHRDALDDELILRFIRERERLLARFGGSGFEGAPNDAISAAQAATDLGWFMTGEGDQTTIDTVRAALALERLCARKQLICFDRPRARHNERGEVRLYCTPDYLERLTATLEESPAPAIR